MRSRAEFVAMARTPLLLSVAVLLGCGDGFGFPWGRKQDKPAEPKPKLVDQRDAVRADTVGALTLVGNAGPLQVKGFGVVVGLNGSGSRDCASSIRTYLIDNLQKLIASNSWYFSDPGIEPADLIESPDTAVVELTAYIDPGACQGSRLDVAVAAATGTQTRSLEGGLLLQAELKRVGRASGGPGIITGRTVGYARGPVFTNPFAAETEGTFSADPRRATVLGGGITLEQRPTKLILKQPSYPMARRIEQRLNETFGHRRPAIAEAMSQSYLYLRTPPRFATYPSHLVDVATHVYLRNDPAFFDAKLAELARIASQPDAPYETLSAAWVGLGRIAVPRIQPLYTSENPALGFYALQAGVRMNDATAVRLMGEIALQAEHPYRFQATRELSNALLPIAALRLLPLLNDIDPDIRVAAYEGLLRHEHPAVQSRSFGHRLDPTQVNLTLDAIESDAPPLIHVRRSRAPRIAVFGRDVPIMRPLFYKHHDERMILNCTNEHDDLTLLIQIIPEGPAEAFKVRPNVVDLIAVLARRPDKDGEGQLRGAGQPYAKVIEILAALSREGIIPAPVLFERVALQELLGDEDTMTRPEADEPTLDEYEAGDDSWERGEAEWFDDPPPDE